MNREEFLDIFTAYNSNTNNEDYIKLYERVTSLIKNNEGHCEERFIDSVFYDFSRERFEVDIFETSDEDAENGDWNETDPDTIYYSIENVLELINK